MKTAMQQAIELVKKYDNREIPIKVLLYTLELLQEKEKEQLIEAVENGGNMIGGEEYYNQTYNK